MNVLLVDDDVEMLESMRRMTQALGPQWHVAGLAEDGVEALELLRSTPVDILVTDITMMDMDGLELIAKAREFCPQLHSLLITCHEDFGYAQEGIQLGVEDYLIKYTLTAPKFHQALCRVREKIEKTQRQQASLTHLSTEVYQNREHFRENLIHTALHAPAAIGPLAARAPLYGFALPPDRFTVTAVFLGPRADGWRHGEEALAEYAVMNMAEELIEFASSFAFRLEGHVYLLLWEQEKDPAWRAKLADRLARLRKNFRENFKTELCAVAGTRGVGFAQLGETLRGLDSLRERCFYGDSVLLEEAARRLTFRDEPVPARYLAALQDHLFDVPQLRTAFAEVCAALAQARFAPGRVRAFFEEWMAQLQAVAQCSGHWLPRRPVTGSTFAACRGQVEALLAALEEACFWQPGKRPGPDVQQAAAYVNANLSAELSLESAAALVHKNSSYFSRQFKKETGLSFSEFVIRQRIRKATYLLEHTELTVEQVAAEVGVANSQYFSTFYKRETGRSPGEVRRQRAAGAAAPER